MSTVAILGGAAFWDTPQEVADSGVKIAMDAGVNHIDVAPSYGRAESLLGPWMKKMRTKFFLGCKTLEREKGGAWNEMQKSLSRLQTDHFDLYQAHAVTDLSELDKVTVKGGALEAMIEGRERGLTQYLGITSHGLQAPAVLYEALNRFSFDSVLFPLNFILFANEAYRTDALQLIQRCSEHEVGIMIIKSVAIGSWGSKQKTNTTWYEPFTEETSIQDAINFVLSYPVNGICTAGDTNLLPKILSACEKYHPLTEVEMSQMIESAKSMVNEPLFDK